MQKWSCIKYLLTMTTCPSIADFCSVYSFSGLFKSLHVSGGPKIMSRGRLWHRLLVPT
jgi:hypothetical protein